MTQDRRSVRTLAQLLPSGALGLSVGLANGRGNGGRVNWHNGWHNW